MGKKYYIIKHKKEENVFIGIDFNWDYPYVTTINDAAAFSSKEEADNYFSDPNYIVVELTWKYITN